MKKIVFFFLLGFFLVISNPTFGQNNDQARKHFNRGLATAESAKSNEDYKEAISEFLKASKLDPLWPDVYYNLGLLYEKIDDYGNALWQFASYRAMVREASEQDKAQQIIDRIEFKKEKQLKLQSLITILCDPNREWVTSGSKCGLAFINLRFQQCGSVVKAEVREYTRMNDYAKKAIPPPIPDIWIPVRFDGNRFFYDYIIHCDIFFGGPHYRPVPIHTKVEGEFLVDPSQTRLKIRVTRTEPKEGGWAQPCKTPFCELIYVHQKRSR